MTIREMAKRANEVLAEAERRGRADLQVAVRLKRKRTPTGRLRKEQWFHVDHLTSGVMGLGENGLFFEVHCDETEEIK